jgi:AcrR family transcriptional regulator
VGQQPLARVLLTTGPLHDAKENVQFSFIVAQVPKDHVREAFVAAAAEAIAELGYAATSMAYVAKRAGSSVGNLYKYFPSKDVLFRAVVPPQLVAELQRRTRARMRAMGEAKDVRELGAGARYHALAGDLLDYCFQHRAAVVIVLARAEGTPYASFTADFVEKMASWALQYGQRAYGRLGATPELGWVLRKAYESFVSAVADALRRFPDEPRARDVIALLTAQHQGGLKRLFETAGEAPHEPEPSHAETPPHPDAAPRPRAGGAPSRSPSPKPARTRARQADRGGRATRRR